ncbi:coadhesin-like [Haliotis cracherodii]|uniref:coadhesin-like n=1 Tax=Haliotis cracherodii TaxID=6455 RepID=UPI0039E790C0
MEGILKIFTSLVFTNFMPKDLPTPLIVPSKIFCAKECVMVPNCQSFFYDNTQKRKLCYHLSEVLTSTTGLNSQDNVSYYQVFKVNGGWSSWSVTSAGPCSLTCGSGQQTVARARTCSNPAPGHGGASCSGASTDSQTQACNTVACPVDGAWASWTVASTGTCSLTCGGGQQSLSRVRTCTNPSPADGGSTCPGSSSATQSQSCNTSPCPVDGAWASWTIASTGTCSLTCGGGQRSISRVRTCTNPSPANGGSTCPGSSSDTQSQSCNTSPCPVDGAWASWTIASTGTCSLTCGGGQRSISRVRTCTNPSPANGGSTCPGSSSDTQIQSCNTSPCPVDGAWASWTIASTGTCSLTCGGGQRSISRVRTCTNPSPANGGSTCPGSSSDTQSQSCNTSPCPVDGTWASWTVASTGTCSLTCGGGQQSLSRARTCTNPSPDHGGLTCPGSSSDTQSQSCNTSPCPVDGAWTSWTVASTGTCSLTCGGGQQSLSRARTCTNPSPANGGSTCPGSSSDTQRQSCNTSPCPVTCPKSQGYSHEPTINICYKIQTIQRTWTDARTVCQAEGGDLIVLQNSAKDTYIRRAIYDIIGNSNVDYYIGGQQTATPGSWKWIDGTPISGFSKSDSNKMCLEIDLNIWDDDFCNSGVQPFVCEIVLT